VGAIPCREGLYSSALTDWRKQRDEGAHEALKAATRGPKPVVTNPLSAGHAELVRENKRLTASARTGRSGHRDPKKVASLLGLSIDSGETP
jgi:transposase-like protein